MSILSRNRVPVKPHRHSAPSSMPFGAGLGIYSRYVHSEPFTAADAEWWSRESLAGHPAGPEFEDAADWFDAAEMEERARQWEWEQRFGETVDLGGICAMCGRHTDELTAGLCDGCNFVLDADLDF